MSAITHGLLCFTTKSTTTYTQSWQCTHESSTCYGRGGQCITTLIRLLSSCIIMNRPHSTACKQESRGNHLPMDPIMGCSASKCTSGLCKEGSTELQLYFIIVLSCMDNNRLDKIA